MSFFKRKPFGISWDRDEDEDLELEEKSKKVRPKSRDFRDLKSENRRRRKEPKKPWGRKERIFILIILVITIGSSVVLALSSRSWKVPGLGRIGFPNITLPKTMLLKEETIVLEGEKDYQSLAFQAKEKEMAQTAVTKFRQMTKNLTGVYGFYVIHLENGFSYGVNENEVFQAASLVKLPVMVAMFMEDENNSLSLSSRYKLKQEDKVSGSGSLYAKPVGYEITYRDLVKLMGKQSDNTAFNICRKLLGDEKINEIIREIGMTETSLKDNETTPSDVGIFFKALWSGNLVSQKSRDEILSYLTDTIYEGHLVAGIPEGIRVAHKFGRELHVVNDAGIVYAEKPLVLVIMSKGIVEKEADAVFPELASIIYEVETSE